MNSKKTLWILILVFVLLLGGASVLYARLGQTVAPQQQLAVQQTQPRETPGSEAEQTGETVPEPVPAPDFTVYDIEGEQVQLSDFAGKPTVVNFWASWCGPCQMEMPDFQEAYVQLGETVNFLMVNMTDGSRETVQTASEFIAGQGYTFPVFYDTQMDAAMKYGVYSLPTTYFIDAQGRAIAQATGAIDAATLQRGIDMITE